MRTPSIKLYSSGSKISKIAVVAALHVAFIGGLLSMKVMVDPAPPATSIPVFQTPLTPVPPTPLDPPTYTTAAPPPISVPMVAIDPAPAPVGPTITVKDGEPARVASPPPILSDGGAGGTGLVAPTQARPPRVYNAALADANACTLPAYPKQALRNGDTGTVTLALLIGPDGKVGASRIARSSGFAELDRAAVAALKLCTFKPATTNGVPESAWGQIAYVWTLD